jgi:hypothetical protein
MNLTPKMFMMCYPTLDLLSKCSQSLDLDHLIILFFCLFKCFPKPLIQKLFHHKPHVQPEPEFEASHIDQNLQYEKKQQNAMHFQY